MAGPKDDSAAGTRPIYAYVRQFPKQSRPAVGSGAVHRNASAAAAEVRYSQLLKKWHPVQERDLIQVSAQINWTDVSAARHRIERLHHRRSSPHSRSQRDATILGRG